MVELGTRDWLNVWEGSLALPEALRPCALLAPLLAGGFAAACRLPVGQRDSQLLELYAALFGPGMPAVIHCGQCTTALEVELSANELRLETPSVAAEHVCEALGYRAVFRLPNSEDLAHIAALKDTARAEGELLERCVEGFDAAGAAVYPAQLPAPVLARVADTMAALDPQAHTELAFHCPSCAHEFNEIFDIGAYAMQSLSAWAERVLDQVHVLARAYGWTEGEVLELSPGRRARYLARVLS